MQTKNTTKVNTGYVITKDGIRMSPEEYIDMVRSERN